MQNNYNYGYPNNLYPRPIHQRKGLKGMASPDQVAHIGLLGDASSNVIHRHYTPIPDGSKH